MFIFRASFRRSEPQEETSIQIEESDDDTVAALADGARLLKDEMVEPSQTKSDAAGSSREVSLVELPALIGRYADEPCESEVSAENRDNTEITAIDIADDTRSVRVRGQT